MIGFIETPTSIIHSLILSIRVDNILLLHKLIVCYQPLLLPSDKLSHNYGKSTHFQWVNQLFLWSFSPIFGAEPTARSRRCWRMRSPSPSLLRREEEIAWTMICSGKLMLFRYCCCCCWCCWWWLCLLLSSWYPYDWICLSLLSLYIYIYITTYRGNRPYKQWWPWYWRFIYLFLYVYGYIYIYTGTYIIYIHIHIIHIYIYTHVIYIYTLYIYIHDFIHSYCHQYHWWCWSVLPLLPLQATDQGALATIPGNLYTMVLPAGFVPDSPWALGLWTLGLECLE